MRNLMWVALIVALGSLPLRAGEPGGPGPGAAPDGGFADKQGGPGQRPGAPADLRDCLARWESEAGNTQYREFVELKAGGLSDFLVNEVMSVRGPWSMMPSQRKAAYFELLLGPGPASGDWRRKDDTGYRALDVIRDGISLRITIRFSEDRQTMYALAQDGGKDIPLRRKDLGKGQDLLDGGNEVVAKALTERDAALAAAQKVLKGALDLVKTTQGADKTPGADRRRPGPPGGPTSKVDILLTHFVLTDEQKESLDQLLRDAIGSAGDRMRGLVAGMPKQPGGPPDPVTSRRLALAMRQIREGVFDSAAKEADKFLMQGQKKDYANACAAIDAYRAKAKEAQEVCLKKLVDAVGVEKANALLGLPGGGAGEAKKETAF